MKVQIRNKSTAAMTLLECIVVIIVVAVLFSMLLPALRPPRHRPHFRCINNLKQIGTAYRIWENDNGDKYPMQQLESLGGMAEIVSNANGAGPYAYLPFFIMQNELGQSPKVVLCPEDQREANTNFFPALDPKLPTNAWNLSAVGSFGNSNVSYLVGVGSHDTFPGSFLGGDRNLGDAGTASARTQDPNYGISGTSAMPSGPCGADVIVNTNGQWESAVVAGGGGMVTRGHAVGWSAKMHTTYEPQGLGNILLGDGSAQQCTSEKLRTTWLRNGNNLGNFANSDKIHTTTNGSIRLLIP